MLTLGLGATLACQSYVPAAVSSIPAKSRVRVMLTDEGEHQLGGPLGARPVALEGRITSVSADSVYLTVQRIVRAGGDWESGGDVATVIPVSYVRSVERQQVDGGKSAALAALFVAGAVFIGSAIGGGGGSGPFTSPPSQTQ